MNRLPEMLKILADKTRFKIINLLLSQDLCVGALASHLGISEAAVSQHLQMLKKAGLVRKEKRGYWTHYLVERDVIVQIADDLKMIAAQPTRYRNLCMRKSLESAAERGDKQMCKCCCEKPEKLKGRKPEECTPEQIKECHGDEKEHPCCEEEEK